MNIINIISFIVVILIGIGVYRGANKEPIKHHEYDDPDLKRVKNSIDNYNEKRKQKKENSNTKKGA